MAFDRLPQVTGISGQPFAGRGPAACVVSGTSRTSAAARTVAASSRTTAVFPGPGRHHCPAPRRCRHRSPREHPATRRPHDGDVTGRPSGGLYWELPQQLLTALRAEGATAHSTVTTAMDRHRRPVRTSDTRRQLCARRARAVSARWATTTGSRAREVRESPPNRPRGRSAPDFARCPPPPARQRNPRR